MKLTHCDKNLCLLQPCCLQIAVTMKEGWEREQLSTYQGVQKDQGGAQGLIGQVIISFTTNVDASMVT